MGLRLNQRLSRLKTRLVKDPRALFYLVSAAGTVLGLLLCMRWGSPLYKWMVQENDPGIRFADYFAHIARTVDPQHLYQRISWDAMGCFPPLAYCMYYPLYRLTAPRGIITPTNSLEAEIIPGALSVFTIYLIFNAVLFYLAINSTGKQNRKKDFAIFTLLMLSVVFAGSGYMMGNSTMLVVVLLLAGLRLRESDRPMRREGGILLIAASVALKLYPAVFGLLFVKERKWKELFRFILYTVLLLFGPFVFFGGTAGMISWIGHLRETMQYSDYGRLQYLTGIFHTVLKNLTNRDTTVICFVLAVAVCLVWTWLAWRSGSRYRTMFFLICIMVFFPANAYRYSLSYFSIPLIMMLKDEPPKESRRWPSGTASLLYGMLYTIPIWWLMVIPLSRTYTLYTLTSVEIYLYLVTYALIAAVMLAEMTARRREDLRILGGTRRNSGGSLKRTEEQ